MDKELVKLIEKLGEDYAAVEHSPSNISVYDYIAQGIEKAGYRKLLPPDEKGLELVAKTCYQYAYLLDDKDIDKWWAGLSDKQTNRFYECARQLLPLLPEMTLLNETEMKLAIEFAPRRRNEWHGHDSKKTGEIIYDFDAFTNTEKEMFFIVAQAQLAHCQKRGE
jgi:hypothetical protein